MVPEHSKDRLILHHILFFDYPAPAPPQPAQALPNPSPQISKLSFGLSKSRLDSFARWPFRRPGLKFSFKNFFLFSLICFSSSSLLLYLFSHSYHLTPPLLSSLPIISSFLTPKPLIPPRLLDFQHSFRLNPLDQADHPHLPFLLNRFGYDPILENNAHRRASILPIPRVLHIVPPGNDVFSYIQFLSISSAIHHIKPDQTIAHMISGTVPKPNSNFWFDEFLRLNSSKSNPASILINSVDDPTHIFGNPLLDVSHKSDVIRLRALRESGGGIYIDTDVIVLRNFDPLLTGQDEIILGVEKADGTLNDPVKINGLCNAVLVSRNDSAFLNDWWYRYRTFNGQPFRTGNQWNYHSVILPWEMAKNASVNRTPVTVLDDRSFFTPLWDDPGLKWIHGTLRKSNQVKTTKPSMSEFQADLMNKQVPHLFRAQQSRGADDVEHQQDGFKAKNLPGFRLEATGQFTYHMWHHLLKERINLATDEDVKSLDFLDPVDAFYRDSSFNRVIRKYLDYDLLVRWVAWQKNLSQAKSKQVIE